MFPIDSETSGPASGAGEFLWAPFLCLQLPGKAEAADTNKENRKST